MNKNYNQFNNYKKLISLINEKVDNEIDKNFITNNIDQITYKFIELSDYFDKITKIILDKNLNTKNKLEELSNIKNNMSTKDAKILMDKFLLKDITGGKIEEIKKTEEYNDLDKITNLCVSNLPGLYYTIFIKSPQLLLEIPKYIVKSFLNIFGINCCEPKDYENPLGFTYLFLFFTASVPVIGGISDFIIIVKSLIDEKFFLATMTLMTRFVSFFMTLNIVDLGLLFKIFYSMDTLSVRKYSQKAQNKTIENISSKDISKDTTILKEIKSQEGGNENKSLTSYFEKNIEAIFQ